MSAAKNSVVTQLKTQGEQKKAAPAATASKPRIEHTVTGMSPLMYHALSSSKQRLQLFTSTALLELQDEIRAAANRVADRHGFSMEAISVKSDDVNGSAADASLKFSTIDPIGLDQCARLLLEQGDEAGLAPRYLGQRVPFARGSGAEPSDFIITGLVPVTDSAVHKFMVRLFDLSNEEIIHCSVDMLLARLKQLERRD